MKRKFLCLALLACLALGLSLGLARQARAAIDLLYFTASTEIDKIFLEWETATELNNAGFYVLRSTTGGPDPANYVQIEVIDAETGLAYTFIPTRGDSIVGAYYPFYDEQVTIGVRYYYFLQDVDFNNNSSYHGPVEVVAGQTPTPTLAPASPTASVTATATGATPTRTVTPTATRTPTVTPTRTATPRRTLVAPRSPTPSPSVSPTSGTLTPSPALPTATTGIPPLDASLTALAETITPFPTNTPAIVAHFFTRTPLPTRTATLVDRGLLTGAESGVAGRAILIVIGLVVSALLLGGWALSGMRREAGQEPPGTDREPLE